MRPSEGTKASYGPVYGPIGIGADAGSGQEPSAHEGAARQEPGTRHGLRLLVQLRRPDLLSTSTSTPDGTVAVAVGTLDVGGSRASMCLMAAEELGIPYDKVRVRDRRYRARSATTT